MSAETVAYVKVDKPYNLLQNVCKVVSVSLLGG